MAILKFFLFIFFWPGDYVSRRMGTTAQKDGGVLRSFVNMSVWGALFLIIVLPLFAH